MNLADSRTELALVGLVLGVGFVLFVFDPALTWWFPSCPFYALTGLLCPLCGSLRALHALVTGSPLSALALNPLTIVGLAAWALAREQAAAWCFSGRGVVTLIAFGVLRNLAGPSGWFHH